MSITSNGHYAAAISTVNGRIESAFKAAYEDMSEYVDGKRFDEVANNEFVDLCGRTFLMHLAEFSDGERHDRDIEADASDYWTVSGGFDGPFSHIAEALAEMLYELTPDEPAPDIGPGRMASDRFNGHPVTAGS